MNNLQSLFYSYEVGLDVCTTPSALEPHYYHAFQILHVGQLLPAFRTADEVVALLRLVSVASGTDAYRHVKNILKQSNYPAKIGIISQIPKKITKILVKKQ